MANSACRVLFVVPQNGCKLTSETMYQNYNNLDHQLAIIVFLAFSDTCVLLRYFSLLLLFL